MVSRWVTSFHAVLWSVTWRGSGLDCVFARFSLQFHQFWCVFCGSPACWILSPLINHGDLFGCFQLGPSQPWHQPCGTGTPSSFGPCTCLPCQDKWHDGHSMCDPPGHGRRDQTLQSASVAKGTATYQCPRWKDHPSGCPFWGDGCLADVGTVFCWKLIVTPPPPPKKTTCTLVHKVHELFPHEDFFKTENRLLFPKHHKFSILSMSIRTRWKLVIPGHRWWRTLRRNGKWIATKEILGGFGVLLLGHLVERCWCWLPAFGWNMLESWSLLVHSFDHLPPRFPSQVAVLELEDRKCWIVIVCTAHLDVLFVCLFGLSREFKPKILLLAGNSVNKTWHPVLKNLSRFLGLSMAIVCVSYHLPKKPTKSQVTPKKKASELFESWADDEVGSPKGWIVVVIKMGTAGCVVYFSYLLRCVFVYMCISNIYIYFLLIL